MVASFLAAKTGYHTFRVLLPEPNLPRGAKWQTGTALEHAVPAEWLRHLVLLRPGVGAGARFRNV